MMKYKLFFTVFCFFTVAAMFCFPVFAQQATVREVVGKVEVKPPNGKWTPAKSGMAVARGSVISTGFNSKATLELTSSVIYVKQLTRLTLEELVQQENRVTTGLYLRTGSLEADVKTGSDYNNNFRVRSPLATAAVRGTKIECRGPRLKVLRGEAVLFNLLKQPTSVYKGETAVSTGSDSIKGKYYNYLKSYIRVFLSKFRNILRSVKYYSSSSIVIFFLDWGSIF